MTRINPLFSITGRWMAGLLISILWFSAAADTLTRLKTLESRISRIGKELNQLHANQTSTEKSLAQLERRIGETARDSQTLEGQIQELKRHRQKLKNALARHRRQLDLEKRHLASQLRIAYALGKKAPLQLIMNLDDPTVFSRILAYHRYLNQARLAQITETQQQLDRIRSLTLELGQNEQQLAGLLEQRRNELQQLETLRMERKKVLAGIKRKLANKRFRLARLEKDKRRLSKLLESVSQASDDLSFSDPENHRSFSKLRGRFRWPVNGVVEIRFGAPRGAGRWEGVVIRAPEGSSVRAIHPGRVIFSDWLRGYGQLIIIRHDHDFMTLYAFNQTLAKRVGDLVKAGEIIATVGNSGGRDRPGLYFAIRHRGEPINPFRWCRHPRKNRVSG